MSAGRPAKWTGMMARVREVIRSRTLSGSMFMVAASTSARTGVAPACRITLTVAAKVRAS